MPTVPEDISHYNTRQETRTESKIAISKAQNTSAKATKGTANTCAAHKKWEDKYPLTRQYHHVVMNVLDNAERISDHGTKRDGPSDRGSFVSGDGPQ